MGGSLSKDAERISNDPGGGLPTKSPDVIEFKWNKEFKIFTILDWHNKDKENNKFLAHDWENKTIIKSYIQRITRNEKGKPKNTKLRGGVNQILRTNWDCIPIYNKTDWKIKRTMEMTTGEFKKRLKKSMNCNWYYNHKWIRMNNQSYVQIVSIDDNVDIGILYQFNKSINKYKPISIHLDGEYLKKYHHILPETNEYNCLDNLSSNITHLSIKNDIDVIHNKDEMFLLSLNGKHHSFSVQDIVEYGVISFVNEWNNNPRAKCANLENILQCFREHDVMNEYIGKGRRKDLMFMLKHKYEVPKAISSALWIFFTNK